MSDHDDQSVFGGSAGSASESLIGTPRLKRKRNKGEEKILESLRAAKEQKTLDSIVALLAGKPETADLVLFQLEAGKLDRKPVPVVSERCLPRSANKMRLVSKEYWEEILALVNGDVFTPEILGPLTKTHLGHLACHLGRIELNSAPPSKRVHVIANWIQRRNRELGNRIPLLTFVRSPTNQQVVAIDWPSCGPFEKRPGFGGRDSIYHRMSGGQVPVPLGSPLNSQLQHNYVETSATIQGEYGPVNVAQIFARGNVALPEVIHWVAVPNPNTIEGPTQAEIDGDAAAAAAAAPAAAPAPQPPTATIALTAPAATAPAPQPPATVTTSTSSTEGTREAAPSPSTRHGVRPPVVWWRIPTTPAAIPAASAASTASAASVIPNDGAGEGEGEDE